MIAFLRSFHTLKKFFVKILEQYEKICYNKKGRYRSVHILNGIKP